MFLLFYNNNFVRLYPDAHSVQTDEIYSVIHDVVASIVVYLLSIFSFFLFVSLINLLESSSACYFIQKKNYWHELCDNCINIHAGRHRSSRRRRHHHRVLNTHTADLMNLFFGTFFIPSNSTRTAIDCWCRCCLLTLVERECVCG